MSTATTEAPSAPVTFFCIWPDHKMSLGRPKPLLRDDGSRLMIYEDEQKVRFVNQRFTTSDPALIALLETECKRQPGVISKKWLPNPVLTRRDDAARDPDRPEIVPFPSQAQLSAAPKVQRSGAVTQS